MGQMRTFALTLLLMAATTVNAQIIVSTYAGDGRGRILNGTALQASFLKPVSIATDAAGNVYVSGDMNHSIRKIDTYGNVTTYAGSGSQGYKDGAASEAQFSYPSGMAIDAAGNLYVADMVNHRIRKIDINGQVTTVAGSGEVGYGDGSALQAKFNYPSDVAVDASGAVYIADHENHSIRKLSNGNVSTFAGTGAPGFNDDSGTAASFNGPMNLVLSGSTFYVTDMYNRSIRKITNDGAVSTLTEGLSLPHGLAVDAGGNLYVSVPFDQQIIKVAPDGTKSIYAGSDQYYSGWADGDVSTALFREPKGLAIDASGQLLVADSENYRIRRIANIATLPVAFGQLSAQLHGKQLQVEWTTLSEKDNAHFTIQASINGSTWQDLGKVGSKAIQGNSHTPLRYQFSHTLSDIALAGFGLLGLLLLPASRSRWARAAMVLLLAMAVISCAKQQDTINLTSETAKSAKTVYIRIAQVDLNGTASYSQAVIAK
jgi:sugar lactone lactonase YvrE